MNRITLPSDAFVNVTNRCNARCIMCDNWRRPPLEEMEPHEYSKLPRSLVYVNVSGGEPFLREDLPEIVDAIRNSCPRAEICISTNGILTAKIQEQMKRIIRTDPSIRVMISIDAIGALHDKIRGVPGAFDAAMASLRYLKELGIRKLGIASIATNDNFGEIHRVMQLAKDLKVDFTFVGVPNVSELTLSMHQYKFDDLDRLRNEIERIDAAFLESSSPRNWVRAYCNSGAYYYATTGKRKLPCFAGTDFFFLGPDGGVHPDMVLGFEFGNIRRASFEEVWGSAKAMEFRRDMEDGRNCSSPCWMMCTVWPHMRRHKLHVIRWILTNKLRVHLGLPVVPVQR